MPISSAIFMILSGLTALVGLFAATVAEGYFYAFSLMLIAFGVVFGYGTLKRHFDMVDAKHH